MRLAPAAMVLALLSAGCSRKPAPPGPGAGIALIEATGAVSRTRGAGPQARAQAGALAVGDLITTGSDGTAVIRLPDGRELELQPGTRLRVKPTGTGEILVELEAGSILSRLADQSPGEPLALTILTPFGITRIPRGPGEALIDVNAEGASIVVALGQIDFVDRDGKPTRVTAGDRLEVSLGGIQLIAGGVGAADVDVAKEDESAAPAAGASDPGPSRRPPPAPGDAIEMVLSSERGQLLVRPPGSGRFVRQRSLSAPPGTGYRVLPGDGRARLVAGGLRAQLSAGAEGRAGDARRVADGEQVTLGLDRGTALVQQDGSRQQDLRVPLGGDEASLRGGGPSAVKLVRGKKSLAVTVLLGEVDVAFRGQRRQVAAGDTIELTARGLSSAPRPLAAITLPTARGLRVHADTLDEVALTWPGDLRDARIEVASDPDFKDMLLAGPARQPLLTVPAPRRGDLHWRVSGARNGTPTTLQGHARFRPDRGRSVLDLAHPRNLVAETGQVTTVYFQSVLPALTFSFAPRPGARRYRVQVYRAGALDRPMLQREVESTRCSFDPGALAEGSYLWNAVALDQRGQESGGGLMNKLELVYDNALNSLAIGSPKPGARLSGPEIDVSGIAPIGSKLYVNGQPAPLDGKGRFEMRVQRSPSVVFRLLENDGSQSYWVRALRPRS